MRRAAMLDCEVRTERCDRQADPSFLFFTWTIQSFYKIAVCLKQELIRHRTPPVLKRCSPPDTSGRSAAADLCSRVSGRGSAAAAALNPLLWRREAERGQEEEERCLDSPLSSLLNKGGLTATIATGLFLLHLLLLILTHTAALCPRGLNHLSSLLLLLSLFSLSALSVTSSQQQVWTVKPLQFGPRNMLMFWSVRRKTCELTVSLHSDLHCDQLSVSFNFNKLYWHDCGSQ